MTLIAKGVDVRQSSGQLLIDVLLQDSSGALVTAGTTTATLYEIQSDGTLKSYDFNDNTFKTTALTTPTTSLTGNNSTTNTGYWSTVLSTLTGFTSGGVYLIAINNTGALPTDQIRKFQFGSDEGDLVVTSAGNLKTDVDTIKTNAVANAGTVTFPTNATLASTINITAGTIANVTNDVGITQGGADKVWSTATRVLTAGTNIVLAKGTGITGFNDITAAAAATAVWTDTTGSDFTVSTSPGKIIFTQLGGAFTTTSSSVFTTAALANGPTGGSAPTAAQNATAVWTTLLAGSDFSTVASVGAKVKLLAVDAVAGGVTLADGVAHGGTPGSSSATLALQQLNATHPAGSPVVISGTDEAVLISSSTSNCISITGFRGIVIASSDNAIDITAPNGSGLYITAHEDAINLNSVGGSGAGIGITTEAGPGILLQPTDGNGIDIFPSLNNSVSQVGINVAGAGSDTSGAAVVLTGGGPGLFVIGTDSPAVQLGDANNGTQGLLIQGNGVNPAVSITTTAGDAISLSPVDGNGIGIYPTLNSNSAADGIFADSAGTGYALHLTGGDVGPTVRIDAGGVQVVSLATGLALDLQGTSGGISVTTAGGNALLLDASSGVGGSGLRVLGDGTNPDVILANTGLYADGRTLGFGILPDQTGATSTTIKLDGLLSGFTTVDQVKGATVRITAAGTGGGQDRSITVWDGTSVATISPAWTIQPATGDPVVIETAAIASSGGGTVDANVVSWLGSTPFTLSFGGCVQTILADGVPHGGTPGSSTATLALQKISVTNATGNAIEIASPNDSAILMTGNYGLDIEANISAMYIASSNGSAIFVAAGGHGVEIRTLDGDGIHIAPQVSVSPSATGISVAGAGTGSAARFSTVNAPTIWLQPTDGAGISITPTLNAGSGADGIYVGSNGTGAALHLMSADTCLHMEGSNLGINIQVDGNGLLINSTADIGVLVGGLTDAVGLLPGAGGYGLNSTVSPALLASFFSTDSGTTYAASVAGSVVKEIADNTTVATLGAGSITDASFTVPSDGQGQATGMLSMLLWLYERFFGKVVKDSGAGTIATYQANGTTVRTTQVISTVGNDETVDAAT